MGNHKETRLVWESGREKDSLGEKGHPGKSLSWDTGFTDGQSTCPRRLCDAPKPGLCGYEVPIRWSPDRGKGRHDNLYLQQREPRHTQPKAQRSFFSVEV